MLALEDRILKPAIRMQIISIAEQFNKLKDENEFEVLRVHIPKLKLQIMELIK